MKSNSATFVVKNFDMEKNKVFFKELAPVLKKMGLDIELKETTLGSGEDAYILSMYYNELGYKYMMRRHAGRKIIDAPNPDYLSLGEVKQLMKQMTAEEVAKQLRISRMTLFRRLKKYKNEKTSENELFK